MTGRTCGLAGADGSPGENMGGRREKSGASESWRRQGGAAFIPPLPPCVQTSLFRTNNDLTQSLYLQLYTVTVGESYLP